MSAEKMGFTQKTMQYAACELEKYSLLVLGERCDIALTCDGEDDFDDGYEISVRKGCGVIRGRNARSVLMGVYGLFYELGCRFIRPGKDGDRLVKRTKEDCTAEKVFRPKYRHRGVCSEGAVSAENLMEMARWLPKIGMNSFFLQFSDGHLFFEKWYRHKGSSVLKAEKYGVADSARHYAEVAEVIKTCGLIFHAVGHGWTTEPLGYITYGEKASQDKDILPEHRKLFAEVGGRRGFFNAPGDTQMCYGNPEAREIVTDAIADYAERHPEVDVIHFWLADSLNNHCECELCRNTLPSDFYVKMLNLLDEKLTAKNIATKIVFLIYCDLLFAPQKEKIDHPERFILMYAPIARNYFEPLYTRENYESVCTAPNYVRNRNRHPQSGGEYLYYLKNWLQTVQCDGFSFEYHLMTFPYGGDPSFVRISRTLYEDMGALHLVGLNGNISCQLQRIFLPTSLPMYVMAKRLCGTEKTFEEIEEEYLSAAFGRQSAAVKELLHETEKFFVSHAMTDRDCPQEEALSTMLAFSETFRRLRGKITFADEDRTVCLSLHNLAFFAEIMGKFLAVLVRKRRGEDYGAEKEKLFKYLDENELAYQPYIDILFFKEGLTSWI